MRGYRRTGRPCGRGKRGTRRRGPPFSPSGYEFVSLVQALMLAGGHESQLTPENRARVEAVTTPII